MSIAELALRGGRSDELAVVPPPRVRKVSTTLRTTFPTPPEAAAQPAALAPRADGVEVGSSSPFSSSLPLAGPG